MSKDITKEDYLNYLVDCKKFSKIEAEYKFNKYGLKCISEVEFLDFYKSIK